MLVRLELTLQFDPERPEELPAVCQEMEAALRPHQWGAFLALARAAVARSESVAAHSTLPV